MVTVSSKALSQTTKVERLIGSYGEGNGPTVIFVAGAHGNEPAGVFGAKAVLQKLDELRPRFAGKVYVFSGNLKALAKGVRFLKKDMNRLWLYKPVSCPVPEAILNNGIAEDEKQYQLLFCELQNIIINSPGPVYIVDLHTTSSESAPYFAIGDTMRNRRFATKIPIHITLGLEEQLAGTMMSYLNDVGLTAVILESGQHDSKAAIDNCISCMWLILHHVGCMRQNDVPNFQEHRQTLEKATGEPRKLLEVRYRYAIKPEEEFEMQPGYKNFQPIQKGETVATNQDGPIIAPEDGRIFMPLYQKQGSDGFFVTKQFDPFWLKISQLVRRLRLDRVLPYLPGFKRSKTDRNTLIINMKIAKWGALDFIHLLGYRKDKIIDGKLVVSKRRYDLREPGKEELRKNFAGLGDGKNYGES